MENVRERPRIELVQAYEDLASEDEQTRLGGALYILRYLSSAETETKTVLTRLFRGLCSGRKAARLGFAVALTELLYQIASKRSDGSISNSEIIDILEAQTRPESGTTGQDERDHYFGRLFGIDAIVTSGVLSLTNDLEQWDRLLNVTCTLALQKPWLRQACGWILCTFALNSSNSVNGQRFTVRVLEKLSENRLIRTPEGLAVWIKVTQVYPNAKLPKHVWKENNPLITSNLKTLADVLKDAKASSKDEDEPEVQGSATWAANLHFVWDIVLPELFLSQRTRNPKHSEFLAEFWQVAVDQALFASTNSKERKLWGLLVVQKALDIAPSNLARVIFSKNVADCLTQSQKADNRYLQRSAQLVISTLQQILTRNTDVADAYVLSFIRAIGYADFDHLTKTKTMEEALRLCQGDAILRVATDISSDLKNLCMSGASDLVQKLRLILNVETKIITQQVNKTNNEPGNLQPTKQVADVLLSTCFEIALGMSLSLDEPAKKLLLERIQLALENILKLGKEGQSIVTDLIGKLHALNPVDNAQIDPEISTILATGWKRLSDLHKKSAKQEQQETGGLKLLYALILFEIQTGDTEAIQILQELLDSEAESVATQKQKGTATTNNADALIEILLSFASRPSKFLRRITLIIFETLAPQIGRDGLQSLTEVLEAKETTAGQQELFEAKDDNDMPEENETDEDDDQDSDVEMLDSDVEMISAANSEDASSDSDSASDSDASSSEPDSDTEMADADLLALETSLAAALGTRKLTQTDTTSSNSDSDSDMTDSEMLELDNKLAEVFRNRASSSSQTKKKERKAARENIVNFKNRVLDMLEVYVRKEHLKPQSLDIVAPLLHLSRTTNTKQLADRAVKLVQAFTKRCSGLENVPVIAAKPKPAKKSKSKLKPGVELESDEITVSDMHGLLNEIHAGVLIPQTSNAHRVACSKASILVVKVLLKAGEDVSRLDALYDDTRVKMDGNVKEGEEMNKASKAFLDDWTLWRRSVKGKVGN